MSSTKGLGRGFEALIPTTLDTKSLISEGERIQNLLTTQLIAGSEQPRTNFDREALEELAESIRQHGIIQPLVVTPTEQNKYSIVAGERRWRAAKIAGLTRVPAIVRTAAALQRLEMALIENVQRVDLSPLEQAISIERLHQQFNVSYVDIGKRLGKATPTINNIVRLLQLPQEAKKALESGVISEGHARAILSLKDMPVKQIELLNEIKKKKLSVRQAEQFVLACKKMTDTDQKPQSRLATTSPQTENLGKKLGTKVSLRRMAKGGKIEIQFKDDSDLERLLNLISKI